MKNILGKADIHKLEISDHPLFLNVERILSMHSKLTEGELQALADWEMVNLGSGEKGTTDWPGWIDVYARLAH